MRRVPGAKRSLLTPTVSGANSSLMVRHLPPLAALRAFEAAARHLNFTRAAEELHLTHGAISHQMKALEASLGARLFRREGRKLLLTDAGQRFASRLRDLLGDLRAAVAEVTQRRDQQELTISVLPSFASLWLIPRLASFHAAHPEIDVNIRATQALAEFGPDGVDCREVLRRGGISGGEPAAQRRRAAEAAGGARPSGAAAERAPALDTVVPRHGPRLAGAEPRSDLQR